MRRKLYLVLGIVSLTLGIIGIVLPIVPTVPFILFASICFSRSSEHLHRWLREHPRFGPPLRDWEDRGTVSKRSKLLATLSIGALGSYPLILLPLSNSIRLAVGVTLAAVLAFIWSRPSEEKGKEEKEPLRGR